MAWVPVRGQNGLTGSKKNGEELVLSFHTGLANSIVVLLGVVQRWHNQVTYRGVGVQPV